jgi:pentatricopeptide repeat protein
MQVALVLELMEEVKSNGIRPDLQHYNCALHACAVSGEWQRAVELLNSMIAATAASSSSSSTSSSSTSSGSSASSSSSGRDASDSKAPLRKQRQQQQQHQPPVPDAVSYNTVISACAAAQQREAALQLFAAMHSEAGLQHDAFSYNGAITACEGDAAKAIELLREMQSAGIKADKYSYRGVIKVSTSDPLVTAYVRTCALLSDKYYCWSSSMVTSASAHSRQAAAPIF